MIVNSREGTTPKGVVFYANTYKKTRVPHLHPQELTDSHQNSLDSNSQI